MSVENADVTGSSNSVSQIWILSRKYGIFRYENFMKEKRTNKSQQNRTQEKSAQTR